MGAQPIAAITRHEVGARRQVACIEGDTKIDDPSGLSQIGACRASAGAQSTAAIAPSEVGARRPLALVSPHETRRVDTSW